MPRRLTYRVPMCLYLHCMWRFFVLAPLYGTFLSSVSQWLYQGFVVLGFLSMQFHVVKNPECTNHLPWCSVVCPWHLVCIVLSFFWSDCFDLIWHLKHRCDRTSPFAKHFAWFTMSERESIYTSIFEDVSISTYTAYRGRCTGARSPGREHLSTSVHTYSSYTRLWRKDTQERERERAQVCQQYVNSMSLGFSISCHLEKGGHHGSTRREDWKYPAACVLGFGSLCAASWPNIAHHHPHICVHHMQGTSRVLTYIYIHTYTVTLRYRTEHVPYRYIPQIKCYLPTKDKRNIYLIIFVCIRM